jgi:hypothetical protein
MDPDPDLDPAIFIIDLQDASKKRIKRLKIKEDKKSKRSHTGFGSGSATLLYRCIQYTIQVLIHTRTGGGGAKQRNG